jgi:xanthine dehydrogenase molybdopterin-binding subunit B
MAKKKKSKSRENPLQGIILRAQGGINQIAAHTLPEIDKDCFIIQAKDIIGNNRIEVLKDAFPLLNSSIITYIGQPLLLILAPTLAKAETIRDSIKTTYISVDKESPLKEPNIINYNFGDFEGELKKVTETKIKETEELDDSNEFENEDDSLEKEEPKHGTLLNFSSTLHLKRQQTEPNPIYKVVSELNDDILEIYAPTQWPALIQDNIASTCAMKKNKIIVHKEFNFSPKDEKVIQPAILSALAAIGTLLTKKSVEIHSVYPTFKSDALIKRITWIDNENNLIAEEIDITIDQGAYPIFSKEMTRQYLAGLMPLYKIKAFRVTFTIKTSNNPPSSFYDGLGYINAIASSQIHSTKLGKHLGFSPFLWREYNLKENEIQSQIVTLSNMAEQKALLETLEEESYFNRKYAAYKVTKSLKTKLSTFSPYARGIGLSIAPGISGFSNYFTELPKQALALTLDVGGKVIINTSFTSKSKSSKIWKKMISEELDVDEKGITFIEEGPEIKDSGPSVLSRNSGNMADLIKKACTQITEKRFIQGLPIEITSEIERQTLKQGTPYFNSTTWTAAVVELRIDPITLEPIVFNVTLFCSLGTVVNENEYIAKIKHSVISTLIEAGAKLASGEYFKIEIKLNHLSDSFTDSVSSVLKGTILASFTSALDMALNEDIEVLPTSSEDLLELIKDKI